jgi:hypothetical protein
MADPELSSNISDGDDVQKIIQRLKKLGKGSNGPIYLAKRWMVRLSGGWAEASELSEGVLT